MKLLKIGAVALIAGFLSFAVNAQRTAVEPSAIDSTTNFARAADSSGSQDSSSGNMYRSSLSSMRRDVPRNELAPDTSQKQRKMAVPNTVSVSTTPASPKPADTLAINSTKEQPAELPRIKLTKKAVIVAAASCGLIGCGIIAYLIKNSKKDNAASRPNNYIPDPPDPP